MLPPHPLLPMPLPLGPLLLPLLLLLLPPHQLLLPLATVDGPTLEQSTVWHGPMEIGLPKDNLITLETTWDQRLLGTTPGLLTVLYVPLYLHIKQC